MLYRIRCLCVDVHRRPDIRMSHDFLDGFDVGLVLTHTRAECVPDMMARKMREQKRFSAFLCRQQRLLIVVIVRDPGNRAVDRSLIVQVPAAVAEDEMSHSVKRNIIKFETLCSLPLVFIFHYIIHVVHHGNNSYAAVCLRGADVKLAPVFTADIYHDVIDADLVFLEVDIFHLSPQTSPTRIPVPKNTRNIGSQ